MEITTDGVDRLVQRCRELVADDERPHPISHPQSLALCIIDAIYATGSHPTAVANVLDRYVSRHGYRDGAKALRYSIAAAGGAKAWAETVACNRKPANTHPGAPLKAEVVDRATRLMADLDIDTVPDLLSAIGPDVRENPVAEGWTALPSQHSAVTYFHLLSLAGSDHFEPDRVVLRYLGETVRAGADGADGSRTVEAVADAEEVAEPIGDHGGGEAGGEREGRGETETLTPDAARRLIDMAAPVLRVDAADLARLVWQGAHRRIMPAGIGRQDDEEPVLSARAG